MGRAGEVVKVRVDKVAGFVEMERMKRVDVRAMGLNIEDSGSNNGWRYF